MGLGLSASALTEVETFACVESVLLDWIEARILAGARATPSIRYTAQSAFWAPYAGEYQLRRTMLELAGRHLLTADRIGAELETIRKDARAIVGRRHYRADLP